MGETKIMEDEKCELINKGENKIVDAKSESHGTFDDFCHRFDTFATKQKFTRTRLASEKRKCFSSRRMPGTNTVYQDSNLQSIDEESPVSPSDERSVDEMYTDGHFLFSKDNLLRLLQLIAKGETRAETTFNELLKENFVHLFNVLGDFLFKDWTADIFSTLNNSSLTNVERYPPPDMSENKVALPSLLVLRWMHIFLIEALNWSTQTHGKTSDSEDKIGIENTRTVHLNILNKLNQGLYKKIECLYLAQSLYLLVVDNDFNEETDLLRNATMWKHAKFCDTNTKTLKLLQCLIRNASIVNRPEKRKLNVCTWITRATELLINITIPTTCSSYDYNGTLKGMISNEVWRPSDIIDILSPLLKNYNPNDQHLPCLFEYVKINKINNTQTFGDYKSFSDILTHAVESCDILTTVMQSIKKQCEKTLSEIINEMQECQWAPLPSLKNVKTVVETVLDELCSFGYPDKPPVNKETSFSELADNLRSHRLEPLTNEILIQSLVTLCYAVHLEKGYWPRIPQMISWYLLLTVNGNHGRILQILPEEGKSCVIAMVATVLVCTKGNVDVVTRSSALAVRDSSEWSEFYTLFNITTSTNTNNITDKDRQECYQSEVVYGTVGHFVSDILRQEFELRDIRGTRGFEVVIVDDVDVMLLDQGIQFTYLSDSYAVLKNMQSILAVTWNAVSQYKPVVTRDGETYFTGPVRSVFDAVLDIIVSTDTETESSVWSIIEEHQTDANISETESESHESLLNALKKELEDGSIEHVVEFLLKIGKKAPYEFRPYIMSDNGYISPSFGPNVDSDEVFVIPILIAEGGACMVLHNNETLVKRMLVDNINSLISQNQTSKGEKLQIPQNLKRFVRNRLPHWINNAFTATRLQEGKDYIINDGHIEPITFIPVGVVESNAQWTDGLQQFLEMKHKLMISDVFLVTNYMSNISFFLRYGSNIFGVTSALGSDIDCDFLHKHYGVDLCYIPTFMPRKLYNFDGVICDNDSEWVKQVCDRVQLQIGNQGGNSLAKAALVICEDRGDANTLYDAIKKNVTDKAILRTKDYVNGIYAADYSFNRGEVIVSTSLSGRGINIELSENLSSGGGLYVLVSFLPINKRIEEHAFNCAGRKGEAGSCELIINTQHLPLEMRHFTNLKQLKRYRKHKQKRNIKTIEQGDLKEWLKKESLFSLYCDEIDSIYHFAACGGDEKNEMLTSVHEFWGIWLQMQSHKISSSEKTALESELRSSINTAIKSARAKYSPTGNGRHIMNYANRQLSQHNFRTASVMYSRAIDTNEKLATIAHYNKAYCLINGRERCYTEKAIAELEHVLEKIRLYKNEVTLMKELVELSWCDAKLSLTGVSNNGSMDKLCHVPHNGHSNTTENYQTSDLNKSVTARLQLLEALDKNIVASLSTLTDLQTHNHHADTDISSIFELVDTKDTFCDKEKNELWNQGLEFTFSVKKKASFSRDGITITILGTIQIIFGILILGVTMGSFLNLGITLIAEGVSDIIDGSLGTYKGEFNKSSWAFSKLLSLSICFVAFSFAKIVTKGLRPALSCVNASWKEVKLLSTVIFKGVNVGGEKLVTETMKRGIGHAAKYAVKETLEQCVRKSVNYMEDKLIEELMDQVEMALHEQIKTSMRNTLDSSPLWRQVDRIVLHIHKEVECDSDSEAKVLECLSKIANEVVNPFVSDLTIKGYIRQGVRGVTQRVKLEMNRTNNTKFLSVFNCIERMHMTCDILDATHKLTVLSRNYVTFLNKELVRLCYQLDVSEFSEQDRPNVPDLHDTIIDMFSDILSAAAKTVFHQQIANYVIVKMRGKVNLSIQGYIRDTLETTQTLDSISDLATQRFDDDVSDRISHDSIQALNACLTDRYIKDKMTPDSNGSLADCMILSECLGKPIEVYGKTGEDILLDNKLASHSEDSPIKLIYNSPSIEHPNGWYEPILNDNSEYLTFEERGQLYHAVARALHPMGSDIEIKAKADELKEKSIEELSKKPGKYTDFIANETWASRICTIPDNTHMEDAFRQSTPLELRTLQQ